MCKSDDVANATASNDKADPEEQNFIERYYEDPRENAMMGYRHRITAGPSLESLKQYIRKK